MSPPSRIDHESFGIGTLFDRMDDAVLVLDVAQGTIVLGNPSAESLFGYSEAELAGMPLSRLLPEGVPEGASGRIETVARAKAGDRLWLEISLSPIESGKLPGDFRLAIVRDIAERKRFEAALEASEARFRAFMDFGPAVASMRDEQGRYVYTNAHHRRLFGSEDWIGTTAFEHFPREVAEQILADDRLVLQTGEPAHFEEEKPGPDQVLTLMSFKFRFQDSSSRWLIGSLGVDITPLKQAQAALLDRTKELEAANEALRKAETYKDEFLSVLSHELRTPITTIYGFTELLEDGAAGPLSPQQADIVCQVEGATQRLLALITNLIDFAQLQAGVFPLHRQAADMLAPIRQSAESFAPQAAAAGLTLHIEVPPGRLYGRIDSAQIYRAVGNMVDNAIRYTPAGGTVTVRSIVEGNRLFTEVADTGCGVAPAHVPKLFDRFWQNDTSSTRRGGGLGLGLPIAKAVIEGHGGTVGASSTQGQGSTFWFTLSCGDED